MLLSGVQCFFQQHCASGVLFIVRAFPCWVKGSLCEPAQVVGVPIQAQQPAAESFDSFVSFYSFASFYSFVSPHSSLVSGLRVYILTYIPLKMFMGNTFN